MVHTQWVAAHVWQPWGSPQQAWLLGRAHLSNPVVQEVTQLPEQRGPLQLRKATAHLSNHVVQEVTQLPQQRGPLQLRTATAHLGNSAALLSQQPVSLPVLLVHAGVCLLPHLLQALLVGFLLQGQLEVKIRRSLQKSARSLQGNIGHSAAFWSLLCKADLNAAMSTGLDSLITNAVRTPGVSAPDGHTSCASLAAALQSAATTSHCRVSSARP